MLVVSILKYNVNKYNFHACWLIICVFLFSVKNIKLKQQAKKDSITA